MNVWNPPQEFDTVKVPVLGGLVKVTLPESEYWLFKQTLVIAVKFWIEHGKTQAVGAE